MCPSDAAPPPPPDAFLTALGELGLELDAAELGRIGRFLGLLLDATAHTNLTAIRDPGEAWMRHALDGLTLVPVLADLPEGATLLDVGTGAGVPGLIVAIARPDLRVTLLDATAKKVAFVNTAIERLGLTNAHAVQGRAEALAHDRGRALDEGGARTRAGGHRDHYDAVTARALGPMAVAAELTVPFAAVGGLIVLVKGAKAEQELAEAKAALHMLHAAHAGTIPTPTGRLVVLEKLRPTPRAYPRRDGEPKRHPLGAGPRRVE